MPAGIKSLSIKILENRTSETGAENIFTNDLIYEITTQGRAVLTDESSADAILSGVIKSMRIDQISHRDSYASLERRVTFTLTLRLKDPTGKVIWSAKDVTENEEYNVSSNKQTTENNRQEAKANVGLLAFIQAQVKAMKDSGDLPDKEEIRVDVDLTDVEIGE